MKQAILRNDLENDITDKNTFKFKQGKSFEIIPMDMFWLNKNEKGGLGLEIGPMFYLRLTNPDRTTTKYYSLFDYK